MDCGVVVIACTSVAIEDSGTMDCRVGFASSQ